MTRDDERRLVAERLRSLRNEGGGVTSINHGYLWSLLWAASGEELSGSYPNDWFERFCARLADLIEPVCDASATHADTSATREVSQSRRSDVDREALLALADELEQETGSVCGVCMGKTARRIRESVGEVES